MLPVVQAGAAQVFLIQLKAKWFYEPQFRADGQAAATDIPGVLRDFGLVKNDV
jgi:hypothetical protein